MVGVCTSQIFLVLTLHPKKARQQVLSKKNYVPWSVRCKPFLLFARLPIEITDSKSPHTNSPRWSKPPSRRCFLNLRIYTLIHENSLQVFYYPHTVMFLKLVRIKVIFVGAALDAVGNPRVIEITYDERGGSQKFRSRSLVPGLMIACRQSRAVMLRFYTKFPRFGRAKETFINWEKDIVYFEGEKQLIALIHSGPHVIKKKLV